MFPIPSVYPAPDSPFAGLLLQYLNAGGRPDRLPARALPKFEVDLTGDGVREIVINWGGLLVVGCSSGQYAALLDWGLPDEDLFAAAEIIEDANRNGLPELVVAAGYSTSGGSDYHVYEWNGEGFRDLLASEPQGPFIPFMHPGLGGFGSQFVTSEFTDIDRDEDLELVFTSFPRGGLSDLAYPCREQYDIFEWDGRYYVPFKEDFAPPVYRFQAVHDGDRHSLFGEWDKALESYRRAISDDTLQPWSFDHLMNRHEAVEIEIGTTGIPTPTYPPADQGERPALAAYAAFRIMLVHLLQDDRPAADQAYRSLLDRHPTTAPEAPFTSLALTFMEEFRTDGDFASSCKAVVHYAQSTEAVLSKYIYTGYEGFQTLGLRPEYLCPFGTLIPVPAKAG